MCTKELIELEKIVSTLYGPNPCQNIISFCDNQKMIYITDTSQFHILFQSLEKSSNSHFNFWILDTLITLIIQKYNDLTEDQRVIFRKYIDLIIQTVIPSINSIPFISNKFSLLVITWLMYDYPQNYQTFWLDFISNIFKTADQAQKLQKIIMLINLLHIYDEELIKFRNLSSKFEANSAVKIKDHMRINAIPAILKVFSELLINEEYIDAKLISKCIKVITELIAWNILDVFEEIMQIIMSRLILKIKYQVDCLEVFNAIIKKGMEPNEKMELLQRLNVNTIIDNAIKGKSCNGNTIRILGEIVNNIGSFLFESFYLCKGSKNVTDIDKNVIEFTLKQLNYCIYFTIQILTHNKFQFKTGLEMIEYLALTIEFIRSNSSLIGNSNQECGISFTNLYHTIENSLLIPLQYKIAEDDLSLLEEEDFFDFRREYAKIYCNCFSIKPLQEMILDGIINKTSKLSANHSLYEIEHCLFLISTIQNGIHSSYLQTNIAIANKFNGVISLLFNVPFTQTASDYILISYYDTISKIIQYILPNNDAIEMIIKLFLSKKGICAEKLQTGIKIINYFDKFLYKSQSQIAKMENLSLSVISTSIKQTLQQIINTGNFPLISEYQLLFHCFSIVISINNDQSSKNKNYKEALDIFIEIFSKYQINNDMFCEVVKCLTHFLKNINAFITDEELRSLFINFFNVFIGQYCIQVLPQKQTKTLYGMITVLQRILIMLGNDSEQYLSFFFDKKNNYITSEVYDECIKILQNLINTTKKSSISFISKHFVEFYAFIKKVKLPDEDISDIGKVANGMYSNYMKLVNTIIYEIPEVLFEINGIENINVYELISFMVFAAKETIDFHTRRNIVRSLKMLCCYLNGRLLKDRNSVPPANISEILLVIMNGTFEIYPKLKLKEPIDSSSLTEMCAIHFYCAGFVQFYLEYLLNIKMTKEQAEAFYQMICKLNPKQMKATDEIIQVFNVKILLFIISMLSKEIVKKKKYVCSVYYMINE